MTYFFIFYALFCLLHLAACYYEWESLRKVSKVGIVPLLILGVYLCGSRNPLLYAGLTLGWLGDVFLIFDRKQSCFILGTLAFVLGHFSYIAATLRLFFESNTLGDIAPYMWLLYGVIALIMFVVTRFKISKAIGPIAYLGESYFTVLTAALMLSFIAQNYLLALAFIIFIISDTILCTFIFALTDRVKRESFYIMLPYILAQTLISFCLL